MDTDLSSAELAGLVLGYLKESDNRVTARVMLEESVDLIEINQELKRKTAVSTKVDNMTLIEILRDYFQVREVVRDCLRRYFSNSYPGGERDSLSSQFMFLLDRINESVESDPKEEPSSKTESTKQLKMVSAKQPRMVSTRQLSKKSTKQMFSNRTTKTKRALRDMKMAAQDELDLRPPSEKRPLMTEANTQTSRPASPEAHKDSNIGDQPCSSNPSLGASKRKKNLLSKKTSGKAESSQSKSPFSKEGSPENIKEVLEYLTSDKAAPIHQRIADKITEAYFLQPEEIESSPGKSSEVPKEKSVAAEIEELVRKFQNQNDPVSDMVLHSVMGESFSL